MAPRQGNATYVNVVPAVNTQQLFPFDAPGHEVKHLKKLLKDHGFVCIFFFRGAWCPYCVGYIQEWSRPACEIASVGGCVVAVSCVGAEEMTRQFRRWGAPADLAYIPDVDLKLASAFGVQTFSAPGFGTFSQPAMFAVSAKRSCTRRPRVLFDWRAHPARRLDNGFEAYPRPKPADVVQSVLSRMAGVPTVLAFDVPFGDVALVSTDIQDSTMLWERIPESMPRILYEHDAIMRASVAKYNGFVSKTEGDAFLIAFRSVPEAVLHCKEVQATLRDRTWPGLSMLRVRMAVHHGFSASGNSQYEGMLLDETMAVEAVTKGGFIGVSSQVYDVIKHDRKTFGHWVLVTDGETNEVVYRSDFGDGTYWGGATQLLPTANLAMEQFLHTDVRNGFEKLNAPHGHVCIGFIKMESTTERSWVKTPVAMYRGVKTFNDALFGNVCPSMNATLMRKALSSPTNDDEALILAASLSTASAHSSAAGALCPILVVKVAGASAMLAAAQSSHIVELFELVCAEIERSSATMTLKGGVHTGVPLCALSDETLSGTDYYGPVVNRAARLAGKARAGQLLTLDTIEKPAETVEGITLKGVPGVHTAYSFTTSADAALQTALSTAASFGDMADMEEGRAEQRFLKVAMYGTELATKQEDATDAVPCQMCGVMVLCCVFQRGRCGQRMWCCGHGEVVPRMHAGDPIVLHDSGCAASVSMSSCPESPASMV
eukprot:TRINITY_DN18506_c0_g1_i1.p1 TRINITY_DN18506_c0_g1~~TRINITY_DN18506_c0_g1_i1.p1  ORF type:complete len:748 (+),score=145.19 TRINITY_DN18506_c0_g1_i1:97-2244(+)